MKKITLSALGLITTAALVSSLYACGTSTNGTCEETSSCAPTSSSGGDGGGDVVAPPDGCDPAADPKDAPKCVSNDFALFVDATNGNDSNAGTRESPMKTINGAIAKAGAKPRIYICEGTYAEHVKLKSGVSLYGGFACTSWTYSGVKAKVAPGEKGTAVTVDSAPAALTVSDLELTAHDATEAGESSVAVLLSSSSSVTMRRVRAAAGKGIAGTNGTTTADFAGAAQDGNSGAQGGVEKANPSCMASVGGAAGGSAGSGQNGVAGKPAIVPAYPSALTDGAGGDSAGICAGAATGRNGSFGAGGAAGSAPSSAGVLSSTGWKPGDGLPGGKGGDGQGGGGGAGQGVGTIGGSGGAGGCGGAGGGFGGGGGASIAIAAFETPLILESSVLAAGDGGDGGAGGNGQVGQLGSANQAPGNNGACSGGLGGHGGSGGGGGGGAGGISVGVLYKGGAPVIDGQGGAGLTTSPNVSVGKAGAFGKKGNGGSAPPKPSTRGGENGSDGPPGIAQAVLEAK